MVLEIKYKLLTVHHANEWHRKLIILEENVNTGTPRDNFNRSLLQNNLCIQESFNTNISHKLFSYKITFLNSHQENTNSKCDLVIKLGIKVRF